MNDSLDAPPLATAVNPGRTAAFIVMLVIATALHLQRFTPVRKRGPSASSVPANGIPLSRLQQLEWLAKYSYGMEYLTSLAPQSGSQQQRTRSQLRAQVSRALRELAGKQTYRAENTRKLGILCAAFGETAQARKRFARAAELSRQSGEAVLWDRIYGDAPLTAIEWKAAKTRLAQLKLAWYEHLATEAGARKANDPAGAMQAQARAAKGTLRVTLMLFVVGLGALGIAVLGLAGTVLAIVFAASGKLRFGALDSRRAPARALLETWTLFFFLMEFAPHVLHGWRPFSALAPTFVAEAIAMSSMLWLVSHLKSSGLTLAEVGWRGERWRANALWGAGGWLIAAPWAFGAALVTFALGRVVFKEMEPQSHPIQSFIASTPRALELVLVLVLAAVVAPVTEELFFRGILHGGLRRLWGPWAGILGSAFVFAALHPQLPLGFPPLFLLGVAFSILYELRGSLIPGMVAHSVNNGLLTLTMIGLFR